MVRGGGCAAEAMWRRAAAEARIVPGDLLLGVRMASVLDRRGESSM